VLCSTGVEVGLDERERGAVLARTAWSAGYGRDVYDRLWCGVLLVVGVWTATWFIGVRK